MIRKTLTTLSLAGLLLSFGLWVSSYWYLLRNYTYHQITLQMGDLDWNYHRSGPYNSRDWYSIVRIPIRQWRIRTAWPTLYWDRHRGIYALRVPLWIPTLAFSSVLCCCRPLLFYRRRKRRKLGRCVKCGYDLRGSKERCPECGTGFSK